MNRFYIRNLTIDNLVSTEHTSKSDISAQMRAFYTPNKDNLRVGRYFQRNVYVFFDDYLT